MRVNIPKDWRCNPHRWKMMGNYAKCYPSWKKEVNDIKLQYRAAGGNSGGSASALSEVEQKVERMERLSLNIEIVEKCCRDATEDTPYYQELLNNVTTGTPALSIARRQFGKYRRKFFYQLNTELEKNNIV